MSNIDTDNYAVSNIGIWNYLFKSVFSMFFKFHDGGGYWIWRQLYWKIPTRT